jgi:acyl-coenzyme A thioesterase PaaI-like protein
VLTTGEFRIGLPMSSPATLPVPGPDREVAPATRASRSAAAATRRITGALVASHAPLDVLEQAATDLAAVADRLDEFRGTSRYDGTAGLGPTLAAVVVERHPFLGDSHPGAPPLRLIAGGREVTGAVTLDARHEGMPGRAHGGWIAALFDQVVGIAAGRVAGRPAATGTLTVRYVAPTPLGCELHLWASAERASDRTLRAHATLGPGDLVTARAVAVLVLARRRPADPDPSRDR